MRPRTSCRRRTIRAWRGFDRFEQRSSVRTWLYRIATNVCLTALDRSKRRPLPSGLGPPSADPHTPAEAVRGNVTWLEPVPDRLVIDERADPAEVVAGRHRVRLALVAGMQTLPPRQRAVFLLCDVLGTSAADTAEMLDVSVGALKSLLQRARARLTNTRPAEGDVAEPTDEGARRVLDRYLAAFEQSDLVAIGKLLADNAVLEMTGTPTWFSGKLSCLPFIATQAIGEAGDWRMLRFAPTDSTRQPPTTWSTAACSTHSPSSCWPPPRPTSPVSRCSVTPRCSLASSCPTPCRPGEACSRSQATATADSERRIECWCRQCCGSYVAHDPLCQAPAAALTAPWPPLPCGALGSQASPDRGQKCPHTVHFCSRDRRTRTRIAHETFERTPFDAFHIALQDSRARRPGPGAPQSR